MAWSTDRKRFALALMLFLIWVGLLATLAVVSASRPADRRAVSTPAAILLRAGGRLTATMICGDYARAGTVYTGKCGPHGSSSWRDQAGFTVMPPSRRQNGSMRDVE